MKIFKLPALAFMLLAMLTTSVYSHELGSNLKPIALGEDQTILDFDKIIWEPLEVEGLAPGAEIALIRGDLDKGSSEVILRTPGGYVVSQHTHTSEERYIWLKGAYTLISSTGEKHRFPGGQGYISFPGNAPKHGLTCDAPKGDHCLLYIHFTRPFDYIYK